MKTASGFLWQLIRSLNSNEKLYFKRNFAGAGSAETKLYVKLFDAIAAQKVYDETAILEKFKPFLTRKNIASQKHYLQRQVSEAIIHYDSRITSGRDIYDQIRLIRIYRKKGLLDEAHAIWKKAVTRSRETESFALLNLLKTEFEKMVLFSSLHTSYDELHSVFKGNVITYNQYAEMITLRDIYTEILLLKRKVHFDLDDDTRNKIHFLLNEVNKSKTAAPDQSFWFRHYHRMSKATLFYLLSDIPASMYLLEQVLADWKNKPGFISTHGEYYIELMYMINYVGVLHGSYNYVQEAFNDPINELIAEASQRANFEAIKYLALNKIFNKTARYDQVEKLVSFMKLKYKQWELALNPDLNRTVNLSLGIACFVLEQYNDALYFTKRGITYFREGTREEQLAVANILLLLITYNLSNSRLFDAQYRSNYTYFYKKKKKKSFEKALVQCLHRSFYLKDNKAKINEFEKALAVFEENKDDVVQQISFSIFNYPGWLISKVQRISYRQYVEKKVKQGVAVPG